MIFKNLLLVLFLFIFGIFKSQHLKGTATYYGKVFHGRKTASGERFDMNKLTCAASIIFKFGTKLRITNIRNNKSVIVRVTDRGSAVTGYKIDLSQGAFSKIANLKSGKIQILIEKVLDSSEI
ncbi:MAG: septal ring lytic transglycosylase RlpA family protein [Lachnospiraceae bacterium]|jgi:rare lipoprotein A|nr:septal ring lytic transglycosylase RlpA family protein [Lachnospiraceae bacterium]